MIQQRRTSPLTTITFVPTPYILEGSPIHKHYNFIKIIIDPFQLTGQLHVVHLLTYLKIYYIGNPLLYIISPHDTR